MFDVAEIREILKSAAGFAGSAVFAVPRSLRGLCAGTVSQECEVEDGAVVREGRGGDCPSRGL